MQDSNRLKPIIIDDNNYRYDSFKNGKVVLGKKKNHLPAMGWNSWNAFGSGNTEALTKTMADLIVELGLDKLGYKYVVLDDGCYKQERVNDLLSNEEVKFPSDFRSLADYIHAKGLKFGMYNDIGTNLCAGAAVGTCGFEKDDANSYTKWDVDFLKVDNCYYLWDNATFSDANNAKYVFAPNLKSLKVDGKVYSAKDAVITGSRAEIKDDYVTFIGTYDGTGPGPSPVGERSSEVVFDVEVLKDGQYEVSLEYATGSVEGVGQWLQLAVDSEIFYDDFVEATQSEESFIWGKPIQVTLKAGVNKIRVMNHRRQENTLCSYAALLEGLNIANPDHDVILSICEWGKTNPQNWGYKVGDSWRILNDITFRVGADGDPGYGAWQADYTTSVMAQYNKAVIMDEFAGLDKGWNDPDMLMIGMTGLDMTMNKSHMTMWAMMNSPLMLGIDLRRVKKGDEIYNIISNEKVIALNQDALGVQAKRVYSSLCQGKADEEYITNNDRVDILAKPLSDGSLALSFINCSEELKDAGYSITLDEIVEKIGNKMTDVDKFKNAAAYKLTDVWTGEVMELSGKTIEVSKLSACDNVTYIVSAM
ncbi:MAG: glycoside hydrolase family 27 protein [Lachnospiraceae bacterium]|nr:glycoside hydrolase family 27 protein [Lachnospiraceae bacterium]